MAIGGCGLVWRGGRCFLPAVAALALCGCLSAGPSWIPAPLVADSSRNVDMSGQDRPYDEVLLVGDDALAELKFSLETLPAGTLQQIVVADSSATLATQPYSLTPAKIFRARLVFHVDRVVTPGYIKVDGAYTPGSDCYAIESIRPQCTQSVAGPARAGDADNPAQALRISERGYYSFDVTDLVRHRVQNGYDGILRVTSVRDPDSDEWGRFVFSSKEKQMGQSFVHHQPQLLVTLTDAVGMVSNSWKTTSVQNSSTDPSLADRDFSQDPHMLMNGAAGERAYALVSPQPPPLGGITIRGFLNALGTRSYRISMITHINSSFPHSPPVTPQVQWYRIPRFNVGATPITWNSGWTEPGAGALLATDAISSDLPSQVVTTDISTGYAASMIDAYAANSSTPNFAAAGTTTVQGAVTMGGRLDTGNGQAPRFITVITPIPTSSTYIFDQLDSMGTLQWCLALPGTNEQCNVPLPTLRARIGQNFAPFIYVNVRLLHDQNSNYRTPINIAVPPDGPALDLDQDPDPDRQDLGIYLGAGSGYRVTLGAANDVPGSYRVIASMPGHNLRTEIQFENLPLPVPSLSGPARVLIPAGSASVTVPADAAVPFVLDVDDAYVNANIDDTTKWLFTSSDPSDTMPGEIQRTDGSVNLAMTFASTGARTITVRSKGDASITATLDVVVEGGSTTTLAEQGPVAVFGQEVTLVAQVSDHAGAPLAGGSVEFRDGASVLGIGQIDAGEARHATTTLGVGMHLISAHYAGDPLAAIAASSSIERIHVVDRAATTMAITAPASSLIDDPVSVAIALGVVAPGAGTPTGTVTISDGETSCTFDVGAASGCSLTLVTAGTRTLSAAYSGDANFLEGAASASIIVLERALLAATLDDGDGYVRYGRMVDYTLTIRNDGLGEATAVPVDATLSAAFDGAFAQWQCFGAGAGASCVASGSGALHDAATIPPGRSLTWFIRAPVLHETDEVHATLTLDIGGLAPQSLSDTNVLVLLRDGFDDPYSTAAVLAGVEAAAILSGEHVHAFALPPASGKRFDTVLALHGDAHEISVQRGWIDAGHALVRLSVRDARGMERVSPWAHTAAAATLAISGLRSEGGITTLLLEGAATPTAMTFTSRE